MSKLILSILALLISAQIIAQETRQDFRYSINKSKVAINIDGDENDPAWTSVNHIPNFINHWPVDSGQADALTHVKVTYDDEFLYILAICYDNGSRVVQSLRRDDDDGHWNSDNFTLVIDPMNNRQNGFMFGVNAGGSQIEAQLNVNGPRTRYDQNWDNKWYSTVRSYSDHWTVEMAIPFKTLRYAPNQSEWGINFIRGDMERNIYSTWTQFPLNYGGIDLNFMGTLDWDESPKKASGKVVLIPYLSGGTQRDFEEEEQRSYEKSSDVGLDAKVAITGSLNLDLTVNPDFSNVDVDQQVTNLSRFSIFFPERRNFFLENGDIFSNFGSWQISPFFSRRIGLIDGEQVPILYGARLTGNVSKKTRIGVLNVQTNEFDSIAAQNYSVAAVHQQVLDRSVIKAIFINREASGNLAEGQFARNGGLEFAYLSNNGKFGNTVRYHTAFTPEDLKDNHFYGFGGNYNSRKLRAGWTFDVVGENYITELGFNPRIENYNAETEETERRGYTRINPWTVYRFFPKSGVINQHGPRTWHMVWLNPDGGGLNERSHGYAYDFDFKNTSSINFQAQDREVNLPVPTSLLGDDFSPLPVGNYHFATYWINYNTDRRKKLGLNFRVQYGEFFNGERWNSATTLNFRTQPWGNFSVTYNYNKVNLPGEYGQANLHLFRTNAQISFSNSMFLTSAIQFNSQSENYNFFTRFQWRYRPMSDLFIVYTDNYEMDNLGLKNRQVVFKLTYWLNL
ncbi:DUF5916 domain-containing protein [Ekhidna sp. To15]|uniref:DUF5916 domain-containing protein n=1 Tax=Ekhidna sp. To15 TaxID=3395267 RepID=UPI003F52708E